MRCVPILEHNQLFPLQLFNHQVRERRLALLLPWAYEEVWLRQQGELVKVPQVGGWGRGEKKQGHLAGSARWTLLKIEAGCFRDDFEHVGVGLRQDRSSIDMVFVICRLHEE